MRGTSPGTTDSSCTPRPSSTGDRERVGGQAAADRDVPALPRARLRGHGRSAAARPDAGRRARQRAPDGVRSIASVYWVRSLVPIETKSAISQIRSADSAAAGVSIIDAERRARIEAEPCRGRGHHQRAHALDLLRVGHHRQHHPALRPAGGRAAAPRAARAAAPGAAGSRACRACRAPGCPRAACGR